MQGVGQFALCQHELARGHQPRRTLQPRVRRRHRGAVGLQVAQPPVCGIGPCGLRHTPPCHGVRPDGEGPVPCSLRRLAEQRPRLRVRQIVERSRKQLRKADDRLLGLPRLDQHIRVHQPGAPDHGWHRRSGK